MFQTIVWRVMFKVNVTAVTMVYRQCYYVSQSIYSHYGFGVRRLFSQNLQFTQTGNRSSDKGMPVGLSLCIYLLCIYLLHLSLLASLLPTYFPAPPLPICIIGRQSKPWLPPSRMMALSWTEPSDLPDPCFQLEVSQDVQSCGPPRRSPWPSNWRWPMATFSAYSLAIHLLSTGHSYPAFRSEIRGPTWPNNDIYYFY